MIEHQEAFDALKETLSTAPVLGYPNFTREFILEMDASLNCLGAILSQQDKDGNICVIAYASQSLCPSKRSMLNYSSAKLDLLVLKWSVTENFQDYLLGSWFQVYTDNNLLTYVQESKLGASQIWWLSEQVLFDFTIKYQTGHSNRAADALSHHQFNPSCDSESESTDSDEVEVISYSSICDEVEIIPYSLVCEVFHQCLNGSRIPEDLKQEAQDISCVVQSLVEEDKQEIVKIVSVVDAVSIFGKVTPEEMKEEQQKDPILELVYKQFTAGEKLETSTIAKVKSKAVRKYLLQFDQLTLKKGVLHHLYINNDVEYHQLILPVKYQAQVLSLLHNGQGHQGLECTLALCLGKILLEYHVPRCHQLCEELSLMPNCKGWLCRSKNKTGYNNSKQPNGSVMQWFH